MYLKFNYIGRIIAWRSQLGKHNGRKPIHNTFFVKSILHMGWKDLLVYLIMTITIALTPTNPHDAKLTLLTTPTLS